MWKTTLYCLLGGVLSACASVPRNTLPSWEAPLNQEHPLAGVIWDVRNERVLTEQALLLLLSQASYVLLGEKHDNPDHHRLQAYVLGQLTQNVTLASVSFEMLDSSQEERLRSVSNETLRSMESLKTHLQWDEQGWDWDYYGPMILQLLQDGIQVNVGNISSDEMMSIYGDENIDAIKGVLSADQLQRLEQEIDESHCGMLPQSQFAAMVRVQQSRDAKMAASLQRGAAQKEGVNVLVAGNFHARHDLGVPNYIAQRDVLLSLSFIELDEGATQPQQYVEALQPGSPYDYLWFTPAVHTQDYCAQLRANEAP